MNTEREREMFALKRLTKLYIVHQKNSVQFNIFVESEMFIKLNITTFTTSIDIIL